MNVTCPHCRALFRVDPANVPDTGVRTRCTQCQGAFALGADGDTRRLEGAESRAAASAPEAPGAASSGPSHSTAESVPSPGSTPPPEPAEDPESSPPPSSEPASPGVPTSATPFGATDPETRARRIARALVSDIAMYHGEQVETSRSAGTLRRDFRDEILKSWEEYVDQVGPRIAKKTPFFREALNEILAAGAEVF